MKMGILTFHYATNYGAILQAYASQTWLINQGIDANIINYVPSLQEALYKSSEIERGCFVDFRKKPIRSFARWLRYKLFMEKDYTEKRNRFNNFIDKQLNLTPKINNINELNDDYFAFICGSDQIWNPEITNGFDPTYFCNFPHLKAKKISYAASIGDVEVLNNEEVKNKFLQLLKNFDSIAVREQTLADFILNNSNLRPTVTLDPTLLLDKSAYDKIAIQPNYIKGDYLLIYQLAPNSKVSEVAKKIAKERNLKIIEINGGIFNTKPHSKYIICNAGPSEYLGLIRRASYIVTNSFHGTVFSVIYGIDFNTILNKKRNSRIIDLLNSLELQNRIVTDKDINYKSERIDFSNVHCILEDQRAQSVNYLTNVMEKKHE